MTANQAGVWHCEPCPAEDMEAKQVAGRSDYECRCKSGFQERKHTQGWWGRDTSCLEQTAYDAVKSYDTASADTITYRDLVGESGTKSVESKLFAQLLIASATGCRRAVRAAEGPQPLLRGNEACQVPALPALALALALTLTLIPTLTLTLTPTGTQP